MRGLPFKGSCNRVPGKAYDKGLEGLRFRGLGDERFRGFGGLGVERFRSLRVWGFI